MLRYHLISKTTCYVCIPNRLQIVQDDILAIGEADAVEKFKKKYKLCPECAREGRQAAVEFDSYVNVEQLPSS